jgi:hypothetical protein
MIDRGPPQRWYPVEGGGYLVRWPHTGGAAPGVSLRVEPGGWDHEHCDGCNRHIEVGRTFWQTAPGSCFWLCPFRVSSDEQSTPRTSFLITRRGWSRAGPIP